MVCEFLFTHFLLVVLVTSHRCTVSFARLFVPWEEVGSSERLLTIAAGCGQLTLARAAWAWDGLSQLCVVKETPP